MSSYFSSSGGSSPIAGSAAKTGVSTPTIVALTIAAPNAEQSYAFPAGTQEANVQNMGTAPIRLAYASGETAGVDYITLPGKSRRVLPKLDSTTSFTLYFQCSQAGVRLEIETWS